MKMIKRLHFFTLLELLVVLFIISLAVGLTGVKVKEAYTEQRFLSEGQQVLSQLSMAQDLMLLMDADVQFNLAQDASKKITFWLEVEKPLNKRWARLVERKFELKDIRSFKFNDRTINPLVLNFSLGNMSKGILELSPSSSESDAKDTQKFNIELLGYPSPLLKVGEDKKQTDSNQERGKIELSTRLYPVEVYKEIHEDNEEKTQDQ